MLKKTLPLIIILLLACTLRVFRLTEIPPGLTHDEANHGREAIQILNGDLRYFFPLNYGSEPLYSYTAAGSMALLGKGVFALRLVNVVFGLATIAATYVWAAQAFDRQTALAAAALLAVSFWPLAVSREALRAGMLPFFIVLAVWFYWQIIYGRSSAAGDPIASAKGTDSANSRRRLILLVFGFAVSIAITLHIYLAARVAWLLFPLFLLYLGIVHKSDFQRSWRAVLSGLLLAGLLVIPMFVYLANNPASQTRLSMLGSTINQVREGNLIPILVNGGEALLAFVWPGYGDRFLAYNIPGRPVFDLLTAVFFAIGIVICLWRWKRPSYAFLLLWFLIGIIPSLVTGPTANTTRNLAAMPAVYVIPAVGFVTSARIFAGRFSLPAKTVLIVGGLVWFIIAGLITARDYFYRWGESPEVRGAYQHTLVEELSFREQFGEKITPLVMSTVYPGPAHDSSIALVITGGLSAQLRWVDARSALILPDSPRAYALIPASTPPHPAFSDILRERDEISLRPDDLDPAFNLYELDTQRPLTGAAGEATPVNFGGAVLLEGASWLLPEVKAGESAELLTIWQVLNPQNVGPLHPPADATEAVFFTHLLNKDGSILAQRDALDAPSWSWQAGDRILQIHSLMIPEGTPQGLYEAVVGIYDPLTNQRLLIQESSQPNEPSTTPVPALKVAP